MTSCSVNVVLESSVTSRFVVLSLLFTFSKADLCASLSIVTYSLARVGQTYAAYPLGRQCNQVGGLTTCRHSMIYALLSQIRLR